MNQEEIWDKIAFKWNEYKTRRNDLSNEFFKIGKGKKVIDLGCGSGRNFIKTDSIVYGVDFSENMIKYAKEKAGKLGIEFIGKKSEVWDTGFEDNYFDSGLLVAVLHCIIEKEKRIKTIKEFFKILKKDAKGFITVWNKTSKRLKNKEQIHKIPWTVDGKKLFRDNYLYEYDELKKELEDVGFVIEKRFENMNNIMVIVKKN